MAFFFNKNRNNRLYIVSFLGVILQICEILRRIDSLGNEGEIMQLVDKLTTVDPLRRGYYAAWGNLIIHVFTISTSLAVLNCTIF